MKKKYIHIPTYLFHIPWLYSTSCYECGSVHWHWDKKGMFVIGFRKVKAPESFFPSFFTKELVRSMKAETAKRAKYIDDHWKGKKMKVPKIK